MAAPESIRQRVTVEEWRDILDSSSVKYEYHDGYLVAMAGGTADHSQIGRNAGRVIEDALEDSPCRVYNSDMAFRLLPTEYRFCDTVITCDPADQGATRELQSPRVLVEVLSPSTEREDRREKFALARACPTVQEYVLIWTRYQAVEVYQRAEPLWPRELYWPGDAVELKSINVRFPVSALYRKVTVPEKPEST